jgi:hypothetical protein
MGVFAPPLDHAVSAFLEDIRQRGLEDAHRALDQPGILKNAYQKGVPVFIPAFTDSELGLDLATWMVKKTLSDRPDLDLVQALSKPILSFNPFLDLAGYTQRILQAKKVGIFTIGGAIAGVAGILFANCVFVSPTMFSRRVVNRTDQFSSGYPLRNITPTRWCRGAWR